MPSGDPAAEATLLRRARRGDERSLRELLDLHEPRLRARIRHQLSPLLRRKVSIADVLQDAYLVVVRRLPEFEDRGEDSFERWLTRIVTNRTRKVVERLAGTAKRDVRREISRDGRADTANFAGSGPTPSQVAMAAELEERAARALEGLPEDYREVLRLLQDEGVTFEEASRRLSRSLAATRKLYGRALARFARDMERGEGGGE